MSAGLLLITILVIGLLTLGIRLSFIVFLGKTQIAPALQQALRFVPIAVLSALIAPALFLSGTSLDLSLSNSRLFAGLVAILVAWRTKNVLLTILAGLACLLTLQLFLAHH
ncbi:AzlD domain-containing protein [Ktedonosporobacter rubrisoli]|uniref:AzlD domain-containing protein n=1 Tax=Ktedonosporobacter rubrisoli TaxID=2509675 RepID=A0A4P6K2W3_KTERU|nr:AzlD domain-containing protein [Ktedonosporobacter rubrisoli]QBD82484.1 AzlD domain-containing protein [Ktedonosporobacter rubrisoli]